jgi:hypothetical protein
MAYSIDFIKRAVAYKQKGHTFVQLREVFGIPALTYYDWEKSLKTDILRLKSDANGHGKLTRRY